MATEIEIRHTERRNLFRILIAQHESSTPKDFNKLIATTRAEMEAEDVILVMREFEEWKNS